MIYYLIWTGVLGEPSLSIAEARACWPHRPGCLVSDVQRGRLQPPRALQSPGYSKLPIGRGHLADALFGDGGPSHRPFAGTSSNSHHRGERGSHGVDDGIMTFTMYFTRFSCGHAGISDILLCNSRLPLSPCGDTGLSLGWQEKRLSPLSAACLLPCL